jgi:hypothetical protein
MTNILSSLFQYILTRSGANPKVSSLVSGILSNLDFGPGIESVSPPSGEEKKEEKGEEKKEGEEEKKE